MRYTKIHTYISSLIIPKIVIDVYGILSYSLGHSFLMKPNKFHGYRNYSVVKAKYFLLPKFSRVSTITIYPAKFTDYVIRLKSADKGRDTFCGYFGLIRKQQ
jgi:hypothetical protein